PTNDCSGTSAAQGRMRAGAGQWIACWGKHSQAGIRIPDMAEGFAVEPECWSGDTWISKQAATLFSRTMPRSCSGSNGTLLRRTAAALAAAAVLLSLLPPLPAFASQIAADSLVGYWKFDEGSGTSATDSSGDGNTGTLTNGPTYSTDVPTTSFADSR